MMHSVYERLSGVFRPITIKSPDSPGLAHGLGLLTKVTTEEVGEGKWRWEEARLDTRYYLHAFFIGIGRYRPEDPAYLFSFRSRSFKSGQKTDGIYVSEADGDVYQNTNNTLHLGEFKNHPSLLLSRNDPGRQAEQIQRDRFYRFRVIGFVDDDRGQLIDGIQGEIADFVFSSPLVPTIGPDNEAGSSVSRVLFRLRASYAKDKQRRDHWMYVSSDRNDGSYRGPH